MGDRLEQDRDPDGCTVNRLSQRREISVTDVTDRSTVLVPGLSIHRHITLSRLKQVLTHTENVRLEFIVRAVKMVMGIALISS